MNRDDLEGTVAGERVRETLDWGSDSVRSELAHAEGWLRASALRNAAGWEIDAVAGAVGAMANAWGRLTLWSRSNGTYDSVRANLDTLMDSLVDLRKAIAHQHPTPQHVEDLRTDLANLQDIYHRVSGQSE